MSSHSWAPGSRAVTPVAAVSRMKTRGYSTSRPRAMSQLRTEPSRMPQSISAIISPMLNMLTGPIQSLMDSTAPETMPGSRSPEKKRNSPTPTERMLGLRSSLSQSVLASGRSSRG